MNKNKKAQINPNTKYYYKKLNHSSSVHVGVPIAGVNLFVQRNKQMSSFKRKIVLNLKKNNARSW